MATSLETQADFYQSHLNRVSRSFAFCIAQLEGPVRNWVGLSYLLCRVLDTVEDAPWKNPRQQLEHFKKFGRFLREGAPTQEFANWRSEFPTEIPEGEKDLLQDAPTFFADVRSLPSRVRSALEENIENMGRGMAHFCAQKVDGALRLRGLREVNQYCFFVAGVVGELLTELALQIGPQSWQRSGELFQKAHRFGLFLQKVNLLKDQWDDEKEGRFLVPSRAELLRSVGEDAEGAIGYLLEIPPSLRSFRLFCAWSLFLGLASLPHIENGGKISREETLMLLARVESVIDENGKLRALFDELLQPALAPIRKALAEIPAAESAESVDAIPAQRFLELYRGALSREDLVKLGIVCA